ncbi:hypothetical protein MUK42_32615 [Musa troglodytarum]|uniref:Uncharacterized protein n=1 Tax=Musa troglodytarum TaxID=320322 RepID=A0A9E7HZP8_9LILI|nr:hypothetical protein MUK42_32615 [Musa troglodytarum]
MWDLTPHTDLLAELPAEYTFETALADLIDNSLQAVWSNGSGERRLVRVTVDEQKIKIFDSGQGMDGSEENCITKWGKMGSSKHRACRSKAIGIKAPYLMTDGGVREPLDEETQTSPHGSFTQVVIRDLKLRCRAVDDSVKVVGICGKQFVDRFCYLNDVIGYYLNKQERLCDTKYTSRKTAMPIEFEVNDINLAEIQGGEVAITNLLSCNGPDFIMQLRFMIKSENPGFQEANARLKFVYFPIVEGKENIERILEKLVQDGYEIKENFNTFSRVSIRRLGRLLPDSRWRQMLVFLLLLLSSPQSLPSFSANIFFNILKTDLAHHHPFTCALRSFGNILSGKESAKILTYEIVEVTIEILKDGKHSSTLQLEKEYRDWVIQMHDRYDEEINCGEDEPVYIIGPQNKKQLGITADGDARLICRPLDCSDEKGCSLLVDNGNASLDMHDSLSFPISLIDSENIQAIDLATWNCQVEKHKGRLPSRIDLLAGQQCNLLGISGELPIEAPVVAGYTPPREIVAVIRPANFTSLMASKGLDQKNIVKNEFEMTLKISHKCGAKQNEQMTLAHTKSDILIESSKLDMIQPSYEAVLAICSQDGLFSAEIPCQVMPGTLSSVRLQTSLQEGEYLVPDEVIEELVLEMFDAYGNHIEEGVEVFFHTDGLSFQDHLGYIRKVNCKGCIDLSGLLTVSASFGSYAHLSVSYDKEIVYKKKFQVAKRELRAVSGVNVLEASKLELLSATESYGTFQSRVLDHMDSSKCLSDQKDLLVKYISHHTQILDEKITEVGLEIGEHERKLKTLNDQKIEVEKDIHDLKVEEEHMLIEPDVMFPVIGTQAHRAFSQDMVMNIKQMEEKKGLLTAIQQEIVKEYEAYTEDMAKFKKRSDRLRELLTECSSTTKLLEWK